MVALLVGRLTLIPAASRRYLALVTAAIVIVAFGVELWAGAALTTYFGGALVQDRFALFAKAAALLIAAVAIATTDWAAEDSLYLGLAMPLVAAFGLMVAASAADMIGLWAGAALAPIPSVYAPYAYAISAVAMVGGGAAALAVRSPRPRMAYLAVAQLGWVAAGLATHFRSGVAASLFLLAAFGVAATCGPALLGRAEAGETAIAGLGVVRPVRAAGLALAMLSLAGAPPLAGFFGELAVAAALAQSGNFVLLGLGMLGSVFSIAAAIRTLRVLYIQSPIEEARRGAVAALPAVTAFSTAGAVVFCVLIAGYGVFGYPILGLADQGAEALGLR